MFFFFSFRFIFLDPLNIFQRITDRKGDKAPLIYNNNIAQKSAESSSGAYFAEQQTKGEQSRAGGLSGKRQACFIIAPPDLFRPNLTFCSANAIVLSSSEMLETCPTYRMLQGGD